MVPGKIFIAPLALIAPPLKLMVKEEPRSFLPPALTLANIGAPAAVCLGFGAGSLSVRSVLPTYL